VDQISILVQTMLIIKLADQNTPVNRGHNMIMHQIVVSSICI